MNNQFFFTKLVDCLTIYTYIYIYIYIHIYIYMYVCMYVCMYINVLKYSCELPLIIIFFLSMHVSGKTKN